MRVFHRKEPKNIYEKLRMKYNVELPKDTPTTEIVDKSFALAYQKHLKLKSSNTMDTFIKEYSKLVEENTIERVHKTLLESINNKTTNINEKSKFSSFGEYFTPDCLGELYNRFIKDAKPTEGTEPMTMDMLSTYLQKGLTYNEKSNPGNFWNSMKELKAECNNMDQFKSEDDFYKSKFYSLIVKAQINELFVNEFTEGIMGNLDEIERGLKDPYKAQKLTHVKQMKKEMTNLLDTRLGNPVSFEELIFKDGTIMDFAGDNLEKILADDPEVMKLLTEKLIKKTFQENRDNSFADRFAQIQIEGQVGIEGIEDAVKQANKKGTWMKIGSWRFGPNNYAMDSAKEFFGSTNKVKKVIDWKNIPLEERRHMSNSIMYDAVLESQNKRPYPDETEFNIMQKIGGGHTTYDSYVVGGSKLRDGIEAMTDKATNGYKDYNKTVEAQAKVYASKWMSQYPKLKNDMTQKQLESYLISKVKEEHMNRNVSDRLLALEDGNGKTIEDKIADQISNKTTKKLLGTTEKQKAARQKRLMREATNPWPMGSKL